VLLARGSRYALPSWLSNVVILTKVAAVIRDTVYIDGGALWWLPGLNDGSFDSLASDGMEIHSNTIETC